MRARTRDGPRRSRRGARRATRGRCCSRPTWPTPPRPRQSEAFDLAGRLGARLLVVSVIDPGSLKLPGGRFRARVDQVRERREQLAQALVERGREEGSTCRSSSGRATRAT